MEGRGHRQRQGTLGAHGLEDLAGLLDACLAAGDHGLLRIVEVHCLNHLATGRSGLQAAFAHRLGVQTEDGGHAAGAHRHRFLHRLGAQAHQRQRIGQAERAGGHQRRVFAQRVTGHRSRRRAALGQPDTVIGDACGEHHRLGVGGEVQGFLRTFGNQSANIFAQGGAGLFQGAAHRGMVGPGGQHAHRLRTLTWEHEGK